MIQIQLTFNSVDEAIVALGLLAKSGKVRRAAVQPTAGAPSVPSEGDAGIAQAPVTPAPATHPKAARKPRNDAGKPRGPYKNAGTADASALAESVVPPKSGGASVSDPAGTEAAAVPAPVQETTPPAAALANPAAVAPPTSEEAMKALEKLFETPEPKGGIEASMKMLGQFGVTKLRDLPEGKRAEFIAAVNAALA